ncbi:glycosyltransferase family 2 protein [uncultured Ruminococcus sp.]|uniref:glycosyltransferase family 2 protein n=1 Tax=uncultured Ruminococcus sp. TaxID=165186 RepID=UPI00260DA9DE|nr:glycosyltransferase family 2 protein [uncultured Ruminococcus sp.]
MDKKLLSFVIPCYRSQNTILKVVDEIERTVKTRDGYDYEIILVNDCSPDDVWSVIADLARRNSRVTAINLAKNFGQHSALLAGYNHCSGDYVISLDDDGQTPADELYKLVDKLNEGFDVVYASYGEVHQNLIRRLGSNFAKAMSDYMFDIKGDNNHGSSYYIAKKFIIDEMIKYKNPYPYMGGLILRVTRNIGFVFVTHRDRMEGRSGYSFKGLVNLWLNGFTAFSVKPLRIGSYVGFISSILGILYAIYIIIKKLFINPDLQTGWSSIISVVMIIGGIIMLMLGLIGEYIGRIYICINNSPQYVIKEIKTQKNIKE